MIKIEQLTALAPLAEIKPDYLQQLLSKSKVVTLGEGDWLFKQGDMDGQMMFVLTGAVELTADDSDKRTLITGGTKLAKQPLSHFFPRPTSAQARTACQCLAISNELFDQIVTQSQQANSHTEVNDELKEDLQVFLAGTAAFQRLSEVSVDEFIEKMTLITSGPNKLIIKQGDEGDYFYILKKGKCQVNRMTPARPNGVVLAELKPGDSFGEDALLSGMKRNANVASMTDVELLRLSKADFLSILQEPKLQWVTEEDARNEVEAGNAYWIDVRLPNEYQAWHLSGSDNIPLAIFRVKMKTLDKNKTYIIYCDNGHRSAAAVYLLSDSGFEAYGVQNGIQGGF